MSPVFRRGYGHRFDLTEYFPPAIKTICIACVSVFVLQKLTELLFGQSGARFWETWFGLVPYAAVFGFRIWQPFTYLFLHAGVLHILFNLLYLAMFGADLERMWGARKFYIYFFLCGVGAGIINVIVKTILDPHGTGTAAFPPTIGASGAIFGVLLAAAVVFPDRQVWLIPFPVSLPMRVYVLIMGAL